MRNRACVWEGEVFQVGEKKTFDSGFTKQDLVCVEDPEAKFKEYPTFTFKKEDVSYLADVHVGDKVKIAFELGGRRWESPKGDIRFFTDLIGKKLEVTERSRSTASCPPPATPTAADMGGGDDDMPF